MGVRVASGRHVALEGADNVRDLGGYQTTDGFAVSAGLLLRGDGLSRLTDGDVERMSWLGVRTVIDFRTPGEVLSLGPDRLPSSTVAVSFPVSGGDLSDIYDLVATGNARRQHQALGEGRASEFMAGTYRSFVADPRLRETFGAAIALVSDGPGPLLFHCTGGKDRTGWMAAVILMALGVPRSEVMGNYLESNVLLRASYQRLRNDLVKAGLLTDPELLRPVMEVTPSYLNAAFHEAETVYGSFESFLLRGLGIDPPHRRKLGDALLARVSDGGRG